MENIKKGILELAIVLMAATCLVLVMVVGFGTLFSGWHLVDDHQFFFYINRMRNNNESLLSVIISELNRDYYEQHRARLLFYPLRVPQAYLFGFNTVYYYVLKAVETVITLVVLYYSARELNLSYFSSAMFSLLSFCGEQSCVWWKLGTPQLQATCFFSIGFYFMIRYLKYNKKSSAVISILFYIFMANFHESYLVLIPFIVLFVIYYGFIENGDSEKITLSGIWSMAKKRLGFELALVLIFASLMIYILFFLGAEEYGIVEAGYPLSMGIKNWMDSMRGGLKYYWSFGILLTILIATFFEKTKKMWMEVILFVSIAAPQFLLYEKEGFYERYMLPLTVGWSLFFIVAMYGRNVLTGVRKYIYSFLLVAMVLLQIRTIVIEADYYRFRGESTTTMLNELLEVSSEGFTVASGLGVCNPEADMTVEGWMFAHKMKNAYYWNDGLKALKEDRPYVDPEGTESPSHSIEEADLFVIYNPNDWHYVADPDVDLSSMHRVQCGTLDLYYSDRAWNQLPQDRKEKRAIKPTIYGIGE